MWKTAFLVFAVGVIGFAGCATVRPDAAKPDATEQLAADTPRTTASGNKFVAPAGWKAAVRGPATVLEVPEGGSFIFIIDVSAADANAAVAAAWAAYKPDAQFPLKSITPAADRDGWTNRAFYTYQISPNERRDVDANVRRANDLWTVMISDMAQDVGEKRAAQINLIYGKFLPKGYERESFAGRSAHQLDTERIAELGRFVDAAMKATKVPGVSVGLYQTGRTIFAGGFGVRALGKPEKVDAQTRYLIASNTKALTTLMLAGLVAEKRMAWDTQVLKVFPSFKLGNADTTSKVLVKHLICACTGLPRQDLEWLLEFQDLTPEGAMKLLGTMQPTSGFGELFQYSNPMAAAAGFIGGHVYYPNLELGAAYDRAMQIHVFDPLGMTDTTFDFAIGQQGNAAAPHAPNMDGAMTSAEARVNYSVIPVRPAGGAWSTVADVMKYVAMEIGDGRLPDGRQYMSKDVLSARRLPQVPVGIDVTYGMGLEVDTVYGVAVVHHGGDLIGFHSDMMWLPEFGVGAVILTNGDPGWIIRSAFRRKLLEVLFDGKSEADGQVNAQAAAFYEELAAERGLLTIPADPAIYAGLSRTYRNPALGDVRVSKQGAALIFDFGEFSSEVGSRVNPDGTTSLITIVPGFNGLEFVLGRDGERRLLTLRDSQHEYTFDDR